MKRLMLLVAICLTSWTFAQEQHPTTEPAAHAQTTTETHPMLPEHATWAGSMVIVILGMFVCAAVVGVVVRLNMPEPAPQPHHDDHGHDEHAADAHGHGHEDQSHGKSHGH